MLEIKNKNKETELFKKASYVLYIIGGIKIFLSLIGGFDLRLGIIAGVITIIIGYFVSRRNLILLNIIGLLYGVNVFFSILSAFNGGVAVVDAIIGTIVVWYLYKLSKEITTIKLNTKTKD